MLSIEGLRKRVAPDDPIWVPLLRAIEAEQALLKALLAMRPNGSSDPEDGFNHKVPDELQEASLFAGFAAD